MRVGYRLVLCCQCSQAFPTLQRAPLRHCSYACAEAAYRPVWRTA